MKTKLTFALITLFALAINAPAQLLWKISGNGLKNPSYLFGTHHVAPLSICDSIAGFEKAFNSCNQIYGELDMSDMQAMAKELTPYMMLPQDSLLDVILTPEQYRKVDNLLKQEAGVSIDQMKMLKPAAIETQLSLIMSVKAFKGFNPNQQLDMLMQNRAKEKGMPVNGFETALFQAKVLFETPVSEQISDLMLMVNEFDTLKDYVITMNNAYMKQDLASLQNIMEDPKFTTPQKQERVIYSRNQNWAKQLNSILPQQATFIVVGAGHLPGDQGLIELLRKQGYTATPVQ